MQTRVSLWGHLDLAMLEDDSGLGEHEPYRAVLCPHLTSPALYDKFDVREIAMGTGSLTFMTGSSELFTIGRLRGLSAGRMGVTQLRAPGAGRFTQICSGARHLLALDDAGDAYLWSWDKLAAGQRLQFNFAPPDGSIATERLAILKLRAGSELSAALVDKVGIAFWWQREVEHLFDESPLCVPFQLLPQLPVSGYGRHGQREDITDLAVGADFIAYTSAAGRLYAGHVSERGLPRPANCDPAFEAARSASGAPGMPAPKYVALYAFYDRLAAVTDHGSLVLGRRLPSGMFEAQSVPGIVDVVSVALGHFHTLALTTGSEVYTWGDDGARRGVLSEDLGSYAAAQSTTPKRVDVRGRAVRIAAEEFRCAVLAVDAAPSPAISPPVAAAVPALGPAAASPALPQVHG